MSDNVNHPKHYTQHPSGVECIQITEHMGFCVGNAIKYLWRHEQKGGVEDLKKARWYIDREIGRQENVNETDFVKNEQGLDSYSPPPFERRKGKIVFNDHSERTAAEDVERTLRWRQGPDHTYTDEEPEHRIRYRDSAAPSDVPYSEIPVTEQEDEGFEVLSVRRDK
jgi:hypothetical protein